MTGALPSAHPRSIPAALAAGVLVASLLLAGCARKVRLESPDGSVSLEYACGSDAVRSRASTPAQKALVRGFALQVIHRAEGEHDFARAGHLAALFEQRADSALERGVVTYLCAHGPIEEPHREKAFPDSGTRAPDFTLPRLAPDGRVLTSDSVQLRDYRGRWVLVSIFGTWCEPCQEEYPSLLRLARRTRGTKFSILGILFQDSPDRAADWLRAHGGRAYPIVMAEGGVDVRYRVTGVPEMVLVDPEGKVAGYCMGCQSSWMGPDSLAAHLDTLMS